MHIYIYIKERRMRLAGYEERWSGRERRTDIYLETNVTLLWTYRCQKANNGTIFAPSALPIFPFFFSFSFSFSSSSSITLLLVLRSHLPSCLPLLRPGRDAHGSNRTRFRKEGCGCDTWTRRLAPRYRDIASIASVTARRYVKEGYPSLSLPLSLDRRQVSGLRRCIPSILLFDVCTTFFFFSIFLLPLESKDFFPSSFSIYNVYVYNN